MWISPNLKIYVKRTRFSQYMVSSVSRFIIILFSSERPPANCEARDTGLKSNHKIISCVKTLLELVNYILI